jgi:hypothetical protein
MGRREAAATHRFPVPVFHLSYKEFLRDSRHCTDN